MQNVVPIHQRADHVGPIWEADLVCYWCGEIEEGRPIDGPETARLLIDRQLDHRLLRAGGHLRCWRCSGPVYLGNVHRRPVWTTDEELVSPA